MKVFNITRRITLSEDLKEATSFLDLALGMLKKSNLGGLIFRTRFGIHTLGLRSSIDVVILDSKFIVVKMGVIKPNKFFFWHPKYFYVLELPAGIINKTHTQVGDQIKITP